MSLDQHVYLGPYLKCKQPVVRKTHTRLVCSGDVNHRLPKRHVAARSTLNFCPICAAPTKELTEDAGPAPKSLHGEMYKKIGDALACVNFMLPCGEMLPGYDVYVPNAHRKPPRDFYVSLSHSLIDLMGVADAVHSPVSYWNDMVWFRENFAREFRASAEVYGPNKVDLGWGLLVWVS